MCAIQEWERSYVLTKARVLSDATRDGATGSTLGGQVKRARAAAAMMVSSSSSSCVKGRVERGEALPAVDVVAVEGGMLEEESGVVEYVVKGMNRSVFVELMEFMG